MDSGRFFPAAWIYAALPAVNESADSVYGIVDSAKISQAFWLVRFSRSDPLHIPGPAAQPYRYLRELPEMFSALASEL